MKTIVTIYLSQHCPYCQRALALFVKKGIECKKISVDGKPEIREIMAKKAGRTSVPQIWIGDKHIGGCDDLYELEENGGELDELLSDHGS